MRRKAAIHNFFKAYRELKKYKDLRLHTRTAKGETMIEIGRYSGNVRRERILKVSQDNETEAYEQATDNINNMLKQIKEA